MVEEYRAPGAPPPITEEPADPKGPHKYRWLFHGPPVTAPGGAVPFQVMEEWADDLGRHLERMSFWSRDELLEMADADGMLDVRTLPAPTFRHDPPQAGPVAWANPGPWVPVSAPAPSGLPPVPDFSQLSDEEAAAVEADNEARAEALRRRRVWKADSSGGVSSGDDS